MNIKIGLNQKSIKETIKLLNEQKKKLENANNEFLLLSCEWIKERANFYLSTAPIGEETKENIKNGWQTPEIIGNRAKMLNTSDKAVFVEFGVGVTGSKYPHDYYAFAGYEYNVPSRSKDQSGGWYFDVEPSRTNIPLEDLEVIGNGVDGKTVYYTHGTVGESFTFQALMDYENYGKKQIWEQIKQKYWG